MYNIVYVDYSIFFISACSIPYVILHADSIVYVDYSTCAV